MLRSDLCDYSDAYIVVKGNITVDKKVFTANDIKEPNSTDANANATNTENDNLFGDNAEDLDVVMSMHNLLEYSKNYKK